MRREIDCGMTKQNEEYRNECNGSQHNTMQNDVKRCKTMWPDAKQRNANHHKLGIDQSINQAINPVIGQLINQANDNESNE
jgi:hypothetical protein